MREFWVNSTPLQQSSPPQRLPTTTDQSATTSKRSSRTQRKRARRKLKASLLDKAPELPIAISPDLLAGRTRARLKSAVNEVEDVSKVVDAAAPSGELTPLDGPNQGQASRSTTSFTVCANPVAGSHHQGVAEASNEDRSDDDEGSTGARDDDSPDNGNMTDTEQLAGKRGTDERSPAKAGMQQPAAKRRPPPTPATATDTTATAATPSDPSLPTAAATRDSTI